MGERRRDALRLNFDWKLKVEFQAKTAQDNCIRKSAWVFL